MNKKSLFPNSHPDKSKDPKASEKMMKINNAYSVCFI